MKTSKDRPSYLLKELDQPLFIAAHFGFVPIEAPRVIPADIDITEDCREAESSADNRLFCDPSEKAAFIRTYVEKNLASLSHPLALAWRSSKGSSPATKHYDYSLELVGFAPGLAEAKLIRTTLSILTEMGHKDLSIEINSMGDKDSINAYERELHNYLKKKHPEITPEVRKHLKDDIFNLLDKSKVEAPELRAQAPVSIGSLSAMSRTYFKEVLEYLEALGVEFRLTPELLANKHFCSETLFAVRKAEGNLLLATGSRYSRLSKRFGFKKELSLIGTNIFGQPGVELKAHKIYKEFPRPKFYLIHLGREARMKSLSLIEHLRQERIPLYHFLGREKITGQMEKADSLHVPYLLILGQKEALDGTVTIRNVNTRAQDTIALNVLSNYLKHIPF